MTKIHEYDIEGFTDHINSIDDHIKFTSEEEKEGSIPFLDTCVHVNDDGSTKVTVYRKPTHTDQYLNFQSNHHLDHKRSVVRTLFHRADSLVSEDKDKEAEKEHVKTALRTNGYPEWIFRLPEKKKNKTDKDQRTTEKKPSAGMPYIRGTSEILSRIFHKHGANIYHKPYNTIRSQVTHVKDPTDKLKKCGVIYHIKCNECDHDYVGETGRQLDIRMKEHMAKTSSAIHEHCDSTGHTFNPSESKVLSSEDNFWKRKVKEAIEIKQRKPSLNRDEGLELPQVYNGLLVSHDPTKVM